MKQLENWINSADRMKQMVEKTFFCGIGRKNTVMFREFCGTLSAHAAVTHFGYVC